MSEHWNGHGAPPSPAEWEALQRADAAWRLRNFRGRVSPQPTFAEVLADERPLDLFLDARQRDKARILQALEQHRSKFIPGGLWDERTPAGREALMLELELGFVPEEP